MPQSALSALGMLVLAVAILFLAYWATRALGVWQMKHAAGTFLGAGAERFRVLAQLSLGRAERLMLVQVQESCLLLGVTQYGVALLKELRAEEAAALLEQQAAASPARFAEVLRDGLRKRK